MILEYKKRSKHEVILFTEKIEKNALKWFSGKHEVIITSPFRKQNLLERLYPSIIKLPLENADVLVVFIGELLSETIILRNNSIPAIGYIAGTFRFVDFLEKELNFKTGSLSPLAKMYGLAFSNLFNKYDELVANSNFVKQKLCRWIRLKRTCDRIHVIHPGVDTEFFKPVWKYNEYFLVVSRIEPLKRLELAIIAFNLFKKLYGHRFQLIITGCFNPKNQYYLNWLNSIAKEDVKFIINPTDDELLKLYQGCYAFIFTSFREPFGITPLEAMSCGKPVIATGQGGYEDYLIDSYNGFVTSQSPLAIAKKMLLLAQNYELVVNMGENARKTALFFDWERFTKCMDHLVDQVTVI